MLDFVKAADAGAFAALAYDRSGAIESASKGVAKIQAGVVGADSERNDKMVVRLSYVSHLDVWYRFRVFFFKLHAFNRGGFFPCRRRGATR